MARDVELRGVKLLTPVNASQRMDSRKGSLVVDGWWLVEGWSGRAPVSTIR
jgi:hypothetical protein